MPPTDYRMLTYEDMLKVRAALLGGKRLGPITIKDFGS